MIPGFEKSMTFVRKEDLARKSPFASRQPEWELVREGEAGSHWERIDRLAVENGWLYRSLTYSDRNDPKSLTSTNMTFVPKGTRQL